MCKAVINEDPNAKVIIGTEVVNPPFLVLI